LLEGISKEWVDANNSGMKITLILGACEQATEAVEYYGADDPASETNPFAEQLSEYRKDIAIIAADGDAMYGMINKKRPGVIGQIGKYGIVSINNKHDNGGWVTYKGGKKQEKLLVGSQVDSNNINGKRMLFLWIRTIENPPHHRNEYYGFYDSKND